MQTRTSGEYYSVNVAKKLLAFLSAIALALSLASCSSDSSEGSDNDLGTIKVYAPVPQSTPYMPVQAQDKLKTFEGSGLTVEVIEGSTPKLGQAMASGQADVAMPGATGFANISSGVPSTIVGTIQGVYPQVAIVRPDIEADNVEDLKKLNWGVTGNTSPGAFSVKKISEKLDWTENDYELTTLGDLPALTAALKSGAIDAFTWGADAAFKLEDQGDAQIVPVTKDDLTLQDMVGPVMFQGFSVNNDYAKDHKKQLDVFFTKFYEKFSELKDDPTEFIEVLEDWGNDKDTSKKIAEVLIPTFSTDGETSEAVIKGSVEYAEFVTGKKDIEPKYKYWKELVQE